MAKTTEDKAEISSDAEIKNLKATGETQTIPVYGVTSLKVIVSRKGKKIFALRFRKPDGKQGGMSLGACDMTARKERNDAPVIGQALKLTEATILANRFNAQRKSGVDVAARQRAAKYFHGREKTFPAQVLDFVENDRKEHRRWTDTAAALGYRFPSQGEDAPKLIKGGLCDRWCDRTVASITDDELSLVVREAQTTALPGWGFKAVGPRPSRGRRLAAALGSFYKWLKDDGRIKVNTMRNVGRPKQLKARTRVLNTTSGVRNADELRWFWNAAFKMDYPYGPLLLMLLLTGCRRSEISRMRWDELSDDFSMLHLPGARTKNKRPHNVPLSKQAQDVLKSVPRLSDTYVFVNGRGGPRQNSMGNFSNLKDKFNLLFLTEVVKDTRKEADVEPWTLHDLRRTVSTGMNSIKISPARRRGGHKPHFRRTGRCGWRLQSRDLR